MKRCPQCDFIYLDSDQVCDLDGTPLIFVDDARIDALTRGISAAATPPVRRSFRLPALIAIVGLGLGLILLLAYYATSRRAQRTIQSQEQGANEQASASPGAAATTQQIPSSLPSLMVSPLPSASASIQTSPKPLASSSPPERPERTPSSRNPSSSNPVSTTGTLSTNANGTTKSGPVTIRLTNGSRIPADEVWRTREGIWYRRNGIVTLIKRNRVAAIEKPTTKPGK